MAPARKLAMVCELYDAGMALRVAGLRLRHPGWPRDKLDFAARRSLRHAGTWPAPAIHRPAETIGIELLRNGLGGSRPLWRAEAAAAAVIPPFSSAS